MFGGMKRKINPQESSQQPRPYFFWEISLKCLQ